MMLAFFSGVLSQGLEPPNFKRSIMRVSIPLSILSAMIIPLLNNPTMLHGDDMCTVNPHVALGTLSFLQAWLAWLLLSPLLRSLKPAIMVFGAYAVSWSSGYWFHVKSGAVHAE